MLLDDEALTMDNDEEVFVGAMDVKDDMVKLLLHSVCCFLF